VSASFDVYRAQTFFLITHWNSGDRLYHEHITWDQATVLRQAGILPDFLQHGQGNERQKLRLPVAGQEAVAKMRDKNSVASNQMFDYGPASASRETQ
jgi:carboxymethylenebutenolidase